MPVSIDDWMRVLATVAEESELRATIKGSVSGGVMAGVMTTAGGLVLGPPGLLVGALVGGGIAYTMQKDKFKPVVDVLKELTPAQKEELYKELQELRQKLSVQDAIELMLLIQGHGGLVLRNQLIEIMVRFLKNTMKMDTITYHE